jgi:hypothetical protein
MAAPCQYAPENMNKLLPEIDRQAKKHRKKCKMDFNFSVVLKGLQDKCKLNPENLQGLLSKM